MKRILFVDKNKNNYYKVLEKLDDSYFMSYISKSIELKKTINQSDPDIVIYSTDSEISLHTVISGLLETHNDNIPIMVFGIAKEPINFELVFGPFSFNDSIDSIIKLGVAHKELVIKNNKLKEENSYLKEGILSEETEKKLRTFQGFKTQIIQEFKRLKRTDKSLSLMIASIIYDDSTLENYSAKLIEDVSRRVTTVIQEIVRDTDIPLSYDNNKVIVLMPDTDKTGVDIVINRINSEVEDIRINQLAHDFKFDVKIGTAITNKSTNSFSELVKIALEKIK